MRVEARAREVTVNTRDFNASKTVFDARHARERKIPRTIPPTADRRPWRDAARRARADDEETATRTHRECIKQTDLELARDAIAAACAGRDGETARRLVFIPFPSQRNVETLLGVSSNEIFLLFLCLSYFFSRRESAA